MVFKFLIYSVNNMCVAHSFTSYLFSMKYQVVSIYQKIEKPVNICFSAISCIWYIKDFLTWIIHKPHITEYVVLLKKWVKKAKGISPFSKC